MSTNTRITLERQFPWNLWWWWTLVSIVGIIGGTILYAPLPDALINPQADENIWLEQPWRLAIMNAVYYTPIIVTQSLVLWNYVRRAWWWPTIILGSVIVIYPTTIWMFENLGRILLKSRLEGLAYIVWELSWAVWFFGLGGSSVYLVAQWVAMLCWTDKKDLWGLSFAVTSFGWLMVLGGIKLFSPEVPLNTANEHVLRDQLYPIIIASLYQLTIGGVLAMIITSYSPRKDGK